jgi:uncharacterized protein
VKTGAAALAILLVAPGCSASSDTPAGQVATAIPERPDGPVLDAADVLPAAEEALLNARLRDYWKRNRTSVVVVSVESLGGDSIEHFSRTLADAWEIGDPQTQRGLLVLVAPNERLVRIEVSCKLENVISDVFAGRVIRERMIPQYKRGALDEGTLAGVDALLEQLDADTSSAPVADTCGANTKQAA